MPNSTHELVTPFAELDAQGLNLQAVFNVADLPSDVRSALPSVEGDSLHQLLLIGHRGGFLWQQLNQEGLNGTHPIDEFTRTKVTAWLAHHHPTSRCHFVYPGPLTVGLQRLGTLAGWHYPSPFMVGVNAKWGSWFAYRAAVLFNTDITPTVPLGGESPCDSCASRICVRSCPANALDGAFNLAVCLDYRRQTDSACKDRCMARNSCPVGAEHRYSDEQISYHYGQSMRAINKQARSVD